MRNLSRTNRLLDAKGLNDRRFVACKRSTHFLRLRQPTRRIRADPIATIVTPRFLRNKEFAINDELTERAFAEPRQELWPSLQGCPWNCLYDVAHPATAHTDIRDLKGEQPVLIVVEVVYLHMASNVPVEARGRRRAAPEQ